MGVEIEGWQLVMHKAACGIFDVQPGAYGVPIAINTMLFTLLTAVSFSSFSLELCKVRPPTDPDLGNFYVADHMGSAQMCEMCMKSLPLSFMHIRYLKIYRTPNTTY